MNLPNKKARFNFEFIENFIAGILLQGTEIKSIREGKVSFTDSFCAFREDGLYLLNTHITPYEKGNHQNHEPLRPRRLLLTKQELKKLKSKVDEKGLTIVPVRIFINDKGWAKVEVALAKGKTQSDKRDNIRERDVARELDREMKNYQ
jgi:SsrA-binding protein